MITGFGPKIRALREQNNWSLDKLGQLAGLSRDYISRIELGKTRNPSITTLGKIADALSVNIHDLIPSSKRKAS